MSNAYHIGNDQTKVFVHLSKKNKFVKLRESFCLFVVEKNLPANIINSHNNVVSYYAIYIQ